MTNSFWTGGANAYANALRKQYAAQLEVLRQRREQANETEHMELDAEIERTTTEYRSKLDSIEDSLF